jgi:hypothetical protein
MQWNKKEENKCDKEGVNSLRKKLNERRTKKC